jgi:membrane associated rhomboid family serine protease
MAAGTILGALAGVSFAPMQFRAGDTLISASWALGGAIVGLVVGIVLDKYKNRR